MTRDPTSRENIVRAARALFIQKGYAGTNIREIADGAGLSMGGLYHHFATKKDIFLAALGGGDLSPYLADVAALVMSEEFPDNLDALALLIRDTLRSHQDFFKLIYVDILEFGGRNVRPVIDTFREAYVGFAASILEEKMERGLVRRAHPVIALRVVTDLIIHFWLEEIMLEKSLATELGMTEDQFLHEMCDVLLHGFASARGRAARPG